MRELVPTPLNQIIIIKVKNIDDAFSKVFNPKLRENFSKNIFLYFLTIIKIKTGFIKF